MTGVSESNTICEKTFLRLDIRTKLLAILVVSQVMLCGSNSHNYIYLKIVAISIPMIIALLEGQSVSALRYAILYSAIYFISRRVHFESIGGNMITVIITGFFLQFMPGMYLVTFILRTTPVREFIAVMQKMHMPDAIVIPVSIMFRFIPSIREEYKCIKRAMCMRGISFSWNPVAMIEYRLIPLLMSVLNIENELTITAVSRGFGTGGKRTSMYNVKLHIQDYVMFGILIYIFVTSFI